MSELEAAIEKVKKFKDGPRDDLYDEETKISLLSLISLRIYTDNHRKIIGDTDIDEVELYRKIEKLTREEMNKNPVF